jgi:hypothetical protein
MTPLLELTAASHLSEDLFPSTLNQVDRIQPWLTETISTAAVLRAGPSRPILDELRDGIRGEPPRGQRAAGRRLTTRLGSQYHYTPPRGRNICHSRV